MPCPAALSEPNPNVLPYPGPGAEWDVIGLGVAPEGDPVSLATYLVPTVGIVGPTGSGKSVLVRNIVTHVMHHREAWDLVVADPMDATGLGWVRDSMAATMVTGANQSHAIIDSLYDETMRRTRSHADPEADNTSGPPRRTKPILFIVEEIGSLLTEPSDSAAKVQAIAAHSATTKIHLVVTSQEPDLLDACRIDLSARIAVRPYAPTQARCPCRCLVAGPRGIADLHVYGAVREFRCYWSPAPAPNQ